MKAVFLVYVVEGVCMKKVEEINAIISEIKAIAAPHEAEILGDARAYLFEEGSNYVKKGAADLARAVSKLLSASYERDHYEVFGEDIEEWVVMQEFANEDGEPIFNMPPVVEELVDCVRYMDVDHAWSVPRW